MKKVLYSFLFSLFVVLSTSLFGCSVPTYKIDYGSLSTVVEYNGTFSFADSGLSIVKRQGKETFTTQITPSMVVSCDDTSSVGDKKLVIEFEEKTFIVEFAVKYKVEFVVDGQVVNTQYVLNKNEIETPDNPSIDGCDFMGWSPSVSGEIEDNTVFEAQFSVAGSGMPLLLTCQATYGDSLAKISLPQNDKGKWQFIDDLSTEVGDAGEQKFDVKFVPSDPDMLAGQTSKVTVNVAKKNLVFKNVSQTFVYDGLTKTPSFELDEEDVETEYISYYQDDAINVGEYEFEIDITDKNYKGSYYGSFEILSVEVKVDIDDKTIKFTDAYPQNFDYAILDNNGEELSQNLVDLMGFSLVKPSYQHAGTYEIGATVENSNFDVTINKGYLTVQKVEHNFDGAEPIFVNGSSIVYGDSLSSVEFNNVDVRGNWSWKDSSIKVLTPTSYVATAVFTPKEDRDYLSSEMQIKLKVNKKALTFEILKNEYTYSGRNYFVDFKVFGVEEGDENVIVVGNDIKSNAGTYDINLSIHNSDPRYEGTTQTSLIINKASIANFGASYQKEWNSALVLQNIQLQPCYEWVQPLTQLKNIEKQKYLAKFTPVDTQNYETEIGEFEVDVIKATANVTVQNEYDFEYNPDGYVLENISCSHEESDLTIKYTLNGNQVDEISNVGTYFVSFVLPESEHFNSTSVTTQVIVNKAQNRDVVAQTVNAKYKNALNQFNLPNSQTGTWSWQDGANVEVGTAGIQKHTAIFTPHDTRNYASRQVEVEFNVAKKDILIPTLVSKDYNKQYQSADIQDNEYYTVVSNPANINVGKYEVVLSLNDSDNCYWSGNEGDKEATTYFEILKITNNDWQNKPTITKTSWNYIDDYNKQTVVAGEISAQVPFGDIVVEYKGSQEDDSKYTTTKPTNAGVYNARIYVNKTNNFNGIEPEYITFEIKHILVAKPTILNKEYNKSPQKADILENPRYEVTQNAENTVVDTYTVKVKLKNINYKWNDGVEDLERAFNFEITKAINRDDILPTREATYGDKLSEIEILEERQNATGIWTWVSEENATVGSAGTQKHTAIFTPHDTHNYESRQVEVEFNVGKQIVTLPTVENKKYTSNYVYSGLTNTNLYTVYKDEGGIELGTCVVELELVDKDNYRWPGIFKDSNFASIEYLIERNPNIWIVEPIITKTEWLFIDEYNKSTVFAGEISAQAYLGNVVIEYKGIDEDDSKYTKTKPTNAGTYTAKVYVTAQEEYGGLYKDNIEFTIKPIEVTKPTILNKEYNKSPQKADILENPRYEVTQNEENTVVDTYTVKVKLKNINYKWNDGVEDLERAFNFEITKAINRDEVLPTREATYGDKLSEIDILEEQQNATGTWSWQDGANAEVGTAGTQTHTAIFTPHDTHNYESRQVEVEFNVARLGITNEQKFETYYNKQEQSPVVSSEFFSMVPNTVIKETNVGSYPFELQLDINNCYWIEEAPNEPTTTVYFKILKNPVNNWIKDAEIDKTEWYFIDNYNKETVFAGEISGQTDFGDEFIIEYKGINEDDSNYTTTKPTNAGSYRVKVYVAETTSYVASRPMYVDFTILPINVEIPTDKDTFYSGKPQSAEFDNPRFEVNSENSFTEADTYTVSVILKDTENYVWEDTFENPEREISFTIKQATNSWKKDCEPDVKNSYTFTFSDENMPTADPTFGALVKTYYSLNADGTYTKLDEFPHNVGSYKVEFNVSGNKNYTALSHSLPFNITPATLSFAAPTFDSNSAYFENTLDITKVWKQAYAATFEGEQITGELSYTAPKLATKTVIDKTVNGIARKYANVTFNVTFKSSNFVDATASTNINLYASCYTGSVVDEKKVEGWWIFQTVTYTQTISVDTYYGSVENAFANNSSGDIIVIPDASGEVFIKGNVNIKSGMRLILPYLNESGAHEVNSMHADNFGNATLSQENVKDFDGLNLQSKITVASGYVITNSGSIIIAGELSAGGTSANGFCGNTARNYAKLVLQDGAKIQSTGTINCFGFIDESYIDDNQDNNNSQVIVSAGTIYMPFVLPGFRGGTYMKTNKDNGITPFVEYEFRNVIPQLKIEFGAKMLAFVNIYASSQINSTIVKFIGDSSEYVIQLSQGSYMLAKYIVENRSAIDDKWLNGVSDVYFYGDANSNRMEIQVLSSVKVYTDVCFFPISWRQNVTLVSGNFKMNQKFKLMTGSKFTVCEDATLEILELNIYEEFIDTLTLVAYKYAQKDAAEFNLFGTLKATKIGGKINVSTTAKIKVTTCGSSTNEVVTAVKANSISTTYNQTYQTISSDALYLIYEEDTDAEPQTISASGYYTYSQSANEWVLTSEPA